MQLNKKLALFSVVAGITPLLNASAGDEVGIKHTYYQESDDRIKVNYTNANFKYDIGADYTFNLNLGYDALSGGTPIWDSISGASSSTKEDSSSGASPCIEDGDYICKDTRSTNVIGDGQKDMSDFAYRNVYMKDTRTSASISLTKRTASRDEINVGFSYSKESDFKSIDGSFSYLYNLDSTRNKSITAGVSYQYNQAKHSVDWKDFKIINTQIGYTQVFSKDFVASVSIFGILQDGELSNPYQRVIRYFDVSIDDEPYFKYYRANEKKPNTRKALGLSTKLVKEVTTNTALHGSYRLYKDDWGVLSNTLELSLQADITKRFSLVPFMRYYNQSKAVFYKSCDEKNFTFSQDSYATNDERLGDLTTFTYGLGAILNITKQLSANVSFHHQDQSNDLKMNYLSFGFNYHF